MCFNAGSQSKTKSFVDVIKSILNLFVTVRYLTVSFSMDLILTLLPPIAAISMFFYMRYQSRRAEEDNKRLFPGLETETPSSSMWQEQLIDLVHLSCAQACWIPTFIRVYFLGVFECLINTFQKSIWTSQYIGREDQIQALVESARDAETPRLAVVTGGDSGIGCELTKALLQSGVHVIISECVILC